VGGDFDQRPKGCAGVAFSPAENASEKLPPAAPRDSGSLLRQRSSLPVAVTHQRPPSVILSLRRIWAGVVPVELYGLNLANAEGMSFKIRLF
jgi:hypothetical protein